MSPKNVNVLQGTTIWAENTILKDYVKLLKSLNSALSRTFQKARGYNEIRRLQNL